MVRFDYQLRDAAGKPTEQDRGLLYATTDIPAALAEVFQRRRRIDRENRNPWIVAFRLAQPLRLLDLTDLFCVRAGASPALITGPHRYTQAWSAGFYVAYPDIDGLYYRSSMTSRPNIVLYERGAHSLPASPEFHRRLSDVTWHEALVDAAGQIGYTIV